MNPAQLPGELLRLLLECEVVARETAAIEALQVGGATGDIDDNFSSEPFAA